MSEVRANTISAANGTDPVTLTKQSAAKAWLFFNGSGSSIRDSFNVASVTDNATGDFTKNMTSAFATANYTVVASSGTSSSDYRLVTPNFNAAPTTTATRMRVHYNSSTPTDDAYISSTSHGDLA